MEKRAPKKTTNESLNGQNRTENQIRETHSACVRELNTNM